MTRPFIYENDYHKIDDTEKQIEQLRDLVIELCHKLTFGTTGGSKEIITNIRSNMIAIEQLEKKRKENSNV